MSQIQVFQIGQVFQTPEQEFKEVIEVDENGEEITVLVPIPLPWENYPPEAAVWCNNNNAFIEDNGDGTFTIMAVPAPTFEDVKQAKLQEINAAYTASVSVAKIGVPEDEILTWDIQRLEALAWEQNPDIATPFLEGLLVKRNEARALHGLAAITIDQLRAKALEKVKAYEMLTEQMTGKRQGLEDSLNEATTIEQINAITWEVGNVEGI